MILKFKLKHVLFVLSLSAFALPACNTALEITANVCGNGVKDTDRGEECDTSKEGAQCGEPGTAAACRFTCDLAAGLACQEPGYRCGADGICRKPTGSFVLSSPLSRIEERAQVVRFDGDVFPDLAVRTATEIRLLRNDPGVPVKPCATGERSCRSEVSARFPLVATGRSRRSSLTSDDLALLPSPGGLSGDSVVAAIEIDLLSFYEYARDGSSSSLSPVIVPARTVPTTALTEPMLLGSVVVDPRSAPAALYIDNADGKKLALFDPVTLEPVAGNIDLSAEPCRLMVPPPPPPMGAARGPGPNRLLTDLRTPPGQPSTIALIAPGGFGQAMPGACVAFADKDAPSRFAVVRLGPTTPPGVVLGGPVLSDIDKNGLLDVLSSVRTNTRDVLVVWRQTKPREFAAAENFDVLGDVRWSMAVMSGGMPPVSPVVRAADLDGDGDDDLVASNGVLINPAGEPQPAPWRFQKLDHGGAILQSAAADINRDGFTDWLGLRHGAGQVVACLGDGGGLRYSCTTSTVGLPKLANGVQAAGRAEFAPPVIADLNGDLVADVLVAEPGSPMGGSGVLAALLGRAFGSIAQSPISIRAFRSEITGITATEAASDGVQRVARDVLVGLQPQPAAPDDKPAAAAAIVRLDPSGVVSTGMSGSFAAVAARDFDGNGTDDLAAVLDGTPPSVLFIPSRPTRNFFGQGTRSQPIAADLGVSPRFLLLRAPRLRAPLVVSYTQGMPGRVVVSRQQGDAWVEALREELSVWSARVVDLEGDGTDELVLFGQENERVGKPTTVDIVRIGDDGVPVRKRAATLEKASRLIALVDAAPVDGRLDLLIFGISAKNDTSPAGSVQPDKNLVATLRDDDTFDAPKPAVFTEYLDDLLRLGPGPPEAIDYLFSASEDFNGDGVRDALLNTPQGATILFGAVEKP